MNYKRIIIRNFAADESNMDVTSAPLSVCRLCGR